MNPFPGPRPFSVDESNVFRGRTRERDDLRDLVLSYRAVLLYSQSGAGKSSLVSAGLLGGMDRSRWLLGRVAGEVAAPGPAPVNIHTLNVLRTTHTDLAGPAPLTLAARLARPDAVQPWVLVLDQFEEVFTAYPERWTEREPFFAEIEELIAADRHVHVLFVLREEYLAELDPYAEHVPDSLRIRYRLERLRRDQAFEAITEPPKVAGDPVRLERMTGLADSIVTSLLRVPVQTAAGEVVVIEGEYVEPVHLQVVCRDLWERLGMAADTPLQAFTDADLMLASYYNGVLKTFTRGRPWREHAIRRWFETQLITPTGVRGIVYQDPQTGLAAGIPTASLARLESEHLVRRVPRAGGVWYELTHDRFIAAIRSANAAFRRYWLLRFALPVVVLVAVGIGAGAFYLYRVYQALDARNVALNSQSKELKDKATELTQELAANKDESSKALEVAAVSLAGSGSREDVARAYATLGLAQLKIDPTEGESHLQRAVDADPWAAVQAVDQYIATAREAKDPAIDALFAARRSVMRRLRPYLATTSELREYGCRNGFVVVGASDTVTAAPEELKRVFLPRFPNATLGEIFGKQQRIYADMFLACEDAQRLLAEVRTQVRPDAYIENWFGSRCPARCASDAPAPPPPGPTLRVTMAREPLPVRCLRLTGALETGSSDPFTAVFGGSFGGGLRMGALSWSFERGALQKMLQRMIDEHPGVTQQALGDRYQELVDVLRRPLEAQLGWSRSIQYDLRPEGGWKTRLTALARTPEFRDVQVQAAAPVYERALQFAKDYELSSERGVAFMFDVVVQSGRIAPHVARAIRDQFGGLSPTLAREQLEVERMLIIGEQLAGRTAARFAVSHRKAGIARGFVVVGTRSLNLERDFGIRLVPTADAASQSPRH